MEIFRRNKNQPEKKIKATGCLLVEDEYGYPVGIVEIKPGDILDQEQWGKNKLEGFEPIIKKVGETR